MWISLVASRSYADVDYAAAAGDFDSDGRLDVLLHAKKPIVVIASDIVIPIALNERVPTVAFQQSLPSGESCIDYVCVLSVWVIERNLTLGEIEDSSWDYSAYEVMRVDLNLDGSKDFFIRAKKAGLPSFVFFDYHAVQLAGGGLANVSVDEVLAEDQIGIGLGDPGVTVEFSDVNGDGSPDLVIRRDGILAEIFYADPVNGLLMLPPTSSGSSGSGGDSFGDQPVDPTLEAASINLLWHEFLDAVNSGDAAFAAQFVSTSSRQKYLQLFNLFGNALPNMTSNWSGFTAVDINSDFATFAVEQNESGQMRLYTIRFVKEEGYGWRIDEM